ncbi:PDCD5-related protein [Flagelloscypha sp. PMI_526]|nr:PDCD5-related protein [Flagelloscypha sp. PMI_526]
MSTLPAGLTPQPSQSNPEEEAAQRADQEEQRRTLMATLLETEARERLSRISLVSPERSQQVESILLRMAQSGQIRGKVSESQLIDLLDQVEQAQGGGSSSAKKSTIVFQRRKQDFDDDFDDL